MFLREKWFQLLPNPVSARKKAEHQPFFLEALAQTCRLLEDEDWAVLTEGDDCYTHGRRVGYGYKFPRVPLVFRPRAKLRSYDESEFRPENSNYSSAAAHSDKIEAQFREEEREGFMFPLSLAEAKRRYGSRLRVAALAAIDKGDGTVRVIFDGTHFVQVNNHIVIQDALEFPGPDALTTAMEETKESNHHLMICLAADIEKAHRRFLHKQEDLGYLGCRAGETGPVWVNRVGTFGVATAPYHFARLAGLIGRFVVRLLGQDQAYQFLYADDLKWTAAGENKYHVIWVLVLAWIMAGSPFKWAKFRGGVCVEYVGFFLDYWRFEIGLSDRRCSWLIDWVQAVHDNQGLVHHRSFVEFLGRLVYSSQVLPWLKCFLAPLYAWKGAMAPNTVGKVPRTVCLVLRYVKGLLEAGHHRSPCFAPHHQPGHLFRTDAKCENGKIVLGGWELVHTDEPSEARWFSVEVPRDQAPWLYVKDDDVSGLSTAAELLASYVALLVFDHLNSFGGQKLVGLAAGTDNLANEHLMKRGSSGKFPLMYIHMQLSYVLFQYHVLLDLQWRPRGENVPADDLTNGVFEKFQEANRVHVIWQDLDFSLIQELFEFEKEVGEWKARKNELRASGAAVQSMSRKEKLATKTKWWVAYGRGGKDSTPVRFGLSYEDFPF